MSVPLITELSLLKASRRQQPLLVDEQEMAQLEQLLLHWPDDADEIR